MRRHCEDSGRRRKRCRPRKEHEAHDGVACVEQPGSQVRVRDTTQPLEPQVVLALKAARLTKNADGTCMPLIHGLTISHANQPTVVSIMWHALDGSPVTTSALQFAPSLSCLCIGINWNSNLLWECVASLLYSRIDCKVQVSTVEEEISLRAGASLEQAILGDAASKKNAGRCSDRHPWRSDGVSLLMKKLA